MSKNDLRNKAFHLFDIGCFFLHQVEHIAVRVQSTTPIGAWVMQNVLCRVGMSHYGEAKQVIALSFPPLSTQPIGSCLFLYVVGKGALFNPF